MEAREAYPNTKERRAELRTLYNQFGAVRVQAHEKDTLSVGEIALRVEWGLLEDALDALKENRTTLTGLAKYRKMIEEPDEEQIKVVRNTGAPPAPPKNGIIRRSPTGEEAKAIIADYNAGMKWASLIDKWRFGNYAIQQLIKRHQKMKNVT